MSMPIPTMPPDYVMPQGVTHTSFSGRPVFASTSPGQIVPNFLDRLTEEKDKLVAYLHSLVEDVDPHTLTLGISVATTLGIGGVAAIYYHRKRRRQRESMSKANVGAAKSSTKVDINNNKTTGLLENTSAGILVLHQCPRGRKTPSIAPYPLKLETFLRVYGISYEVDFNGSEPRTSSSPWITLDLEQISDSHNCLKFIVDKYGVDLEQEHDEKDRAVALAYNHMLENHLYWGIALWRWVFDGANSLKDIQVLPKKTLDVIPDVSRTVEQAAWFHGLGKKTPKDVIASVIEDLKSLSDFLGKKKFFLGGDKATELDCTAFAMLSQMLWNMDRSPFNIAVKETYKNLSDFCWRMRVRYWPDWDNCLNNTEIADD